MNEKRFRWLELVDSIAQEDHPSPALLECEWQCKQLSEDFSRIEKKYEQIAEILQVLEKKAD